jgi:hypothetical protein
MGACTGRNSAESEVLADALGGARSRARSGWGDARFWRIDAATCASSWGRSACTGRSLRNRLGGARAWRCLEVLARSRALEVVLVLLGNVPNIQILVDQVLCITRAV